MAGKTKAAKAAAGEQQDAILRCGSELEVEGGPLEGQTFRCELADGHDGAHQARRPPAPKDATGGWSGKPVTWQD